MKVKIPDDVAGNPVYSNVMMTREYGPDFVLDFGVLLPEMGLVLGKTRIILSPAMLKMMQGALQTSVKNYEAAHGEIKTEQGGMQNTGNGMMVFKTGLN